MEGVTLRVATVEDAEALARLRLDCWDDAYTGLIPQHVLDERRADIPAEVERRRQHLASGARILLAEQGGGPVGFAISGREREDDIDLDLKLFALYVRAAYWGTGVGHALFSESVGDRDCYLWVLEGNDRAIGFYKRHGFVLDGGRQDAPEGVHLRMVREQRNCAH